jgi:hypothetical protein
LDSCSSDADRSRREGEGGRSSHLELIAKTGESVEISLN